MSNDLPPAVEPPPVGPPPVGPPPAAPPVPTPASDLFTWLRGLGIVRPDDDRWGAGVAVGLARRSGLDPLLVRGLFVAFSVVGGLGITLYGLAWLLLPQQNGRIHLQEAMHGRFSAGFVGAVLLSLSLFGDPGPWGDNIWVGPPRLVAWFLLLGLIWWIVRHRRDETGGSIPSAGSHAMGDAPPYGSPSAYSAPQIAPQPWTPPALGPDHSRSSRRITRATLGLALISAAAVLLFGQLEGGIDGPDGLIAAAAALGVVALGVLTAGLLGRRSGGLAGIGVLLTIAVLFGAGTNEAGVRPGQNTALVGEYTWAPASRPAASQQYNLGAGQAELRLTNPALLRGVTASAPLEIDVRVGLGQLIVVLPDQPYRVVTDLGAGEVTEPGGRVHQVDGAEHRVTVAQPAEPSPGAAPVLILHIRMGAGEVLLKNAENANV
jgi:phage shock protein PspC (stress-responsive transcriptional regulator)